MKKKFDLTMKKVIIFAIVSGIYTALMAIIPWFKDTSFRDITISFEVWILFGIFIIMNSKSNKDSALKCFIFFLISQPLVYILQIPFSDLGVGILGYYKNWIVWTILTIPMGYIGYYLKKDKWWGLLILTPVLMFLGYHYFYFIKQMVFYFPNHLLSTIFCLLTIIFYPIYIFKNKKVKRVGIIISIVIVILATILGFTNKIVYNTDILISGGKTDLIFDDTYKAYLENDKLGIVTLKYDEGLEDYLVNGKFTKAGKTNLIMEDKDGNKTFFELIVNYNNYDIKRK